MLVVPDPSGVTGDVRPSLGEDLLDEYLVFVAARCRPNTMLAVLFDLRVFFRVVGKPAMEVTTADVLAFIVEQRAPRRGNVVRIADGESGMAASTIKRRLASVSGLFSYLTARGLVPVNPVPRGLAARRPGARGVPLIRAPRRLPRILAPGEVTALLAALRTHRDRALVLVMVLGGLRRIEALGLALGDLQPGDRRVRITQAKGGRERIVPVDDAFFRALRDYLDGERPGDAATDRVFVVLKGPNRGRPLSASGA
ncbi:MAG: integrase/recombinase XerD, partial [Actinomycetota bacterium]|nr:integrase/recombinase XerD [Actinomycetota bacterium]